MDSAWASVMVAVAIFAVFAGLSAWWHQRRRLDTLQRDLAWSEQSRLLAEEKLESMATQSSSAPTVPAALHARTASALPASQQAAMATAASDRGQRQVVLDGTLHRMQQRVDPAWHDTEPTARPDVGHATQPQPTRH